MQPRQGQQQSSDPTFTLAFGVRFAFPLNLWCSAWHKLHAVCLKPAMPHARLFTNRILPLLYRICHYYLVTFHPHTVRVSFQLLHASKKALRENSTGVTSRFSGCFSSFTPEYPHWNHWSCISPGTKKSIRPQHRFPPQKGTFNFRWRLHFLNKPSASSFLHTYTLNPAWKIRLTPTPSETILSFLYNSKRTFY